MIIKDFVLGSSPIDEYRFSIILLLSFKALTDSRLFPRIIACKTVEQKKRIFFGVNA